MLNNSTKNQEEDVMKRKLVVIIVLTAFLLSSCTPILASQSHPVTFSVLYNNLADVPFRNDWLILQEYYKRQNVSLDVRLGDDKAFDKAITQALDSADIPDIILKCWPEQVDSYANNGLLLPFSDYENLMPYFKAYIAKNNLQPELDKLKMKNGKYYILPGYKREIQVQQWIYREDIFEKNGLNAPTTYDELYDSLVVLKKLYPASTPITAYWNGAHLFAMMGAGYGIPSGWAGATYYNVKEDVWQYSPATNNFKELYRFLNRCYSAGVLDPAIFTQDDKAFYLKLVDGSALVTVTWITSGFDTWNASLKDNGFPDGKWAALPVMASTIGIKGLPPLDRYKKGVVVPARVASEPYFDELLKFLDWAIYSPEGITLTSWGVEGITYTSSIAGKAFVSTIKTPKNPNGTVDSSAEYGLNRFFDMVEDPSFEDYKKPAEIVDFLNTSLKNNETLPLNPHLKLDMDDSKVAGIINDMLTPYLAEASMKFIIGELSIDRDWDTYIKGLESNGYKTLEEIWNTAWAKQK